MEKITNVRILDLMGLLYNLSKRYAVIDIIIDSENRRVILDPIEENEEVPNQIDIGDIIQETLKLTDQNIIDLI